MKKTILVIATAATLLIGCSKKENNSPDGNYTCTCTTTSQPGNKVSVSTSTISASSKGAATSDCKKRSYTSPVNATTGAQKTQTCNL